MKVTFRVRGDNATEIRERAEAQAEAFFGHDEAALKIDVAPVEVWRSEPVQGSYTTWEAEVEARDE